VVGYYIGFLGVIGLMIWVRCVLARRFDRIAKSKGYNDNNEENIFIICLFLGLPGYIYVMALPDLVKENREKEILIHLMESNNCCSSNRRSTIDCGTSKIVHGNEIPSNANTYTDNKKVYVCPICHRKVLFGDDYCSGCGRKFKWNK